MLLLSGVHDAKDEWIDSNCFICLLARYMAESIDDGQNENSVEESVEELLNIPSLEKRMSNGATIIIDADNVPESQFGVIQQLVCDMHYRVSSLVLDGGEDNNAVFGLFPERVKYNLDNKSDLENIFLYGEHVDISPYKAVNFVGDIHGCFTALNALLGKITDDCKLRDDELYVFCGDYIDKGIENIEVLRFLFSIMYNDNVILLEGNHEHNLIDWIDDKYIKCQQFYNTKNAIEESDITKGDCFTFFEQLKPAIILDRPDGKKILACHGGIDRIAKPFYMMSVANLVNGNGNYSNTDTTENRWEKGEGQKGNYMVHAHKRNSDFMVNPYPHVYNLEGNVEHGGELRCVRFIDGVDKPEFISVGNDIFAYEPYDMLDTMTDEEVVEALRRDPNMIVKNLNNGMSAFILSRDCMVKNAWKRQKVRARYLYVDEDDSLIARSYDKIYEIGESDFNSLDEVARRMTFPVTVYVKENGCNGIVSAPKSPDDLFIVAKNSVRGAYNSTFKRCVFNTLGNKSKRFGKLLHDMEASAVFEMIDPAIDKHIVEYDEPKLVLCGIIYNDYDFEQVPYDELCAIAREYRLAVKEEATKINTLNELKKWYSEVTAQGYRYDDERTVKGFIIEDAYGQEIYKVKTDWYCFWKNVRNLIREVERNGTSVRIERQQSKPYYDELKAIYSWLLNDESSIKTETGKYPDMIEIQKLWHAYRGDAFPADM